MQLKYILLLPLLCWNLAFGIELDKIDTIMTTNINQTLTLLKEIPHNADDSKIQNLANEIFVLFDPLFDYQLVGQLALSKHYKTLTQEQLKEFYTAFEANLKRSFTDKLKLYKDETIEVVGGEKTKANRYNLKASIILDGKLNTIIFKFYSDKNNDWKIYDVDVLGVSVVQTYRSQIDDILTHSNFQVLLNKLQNEVSFESKP